LNTRSLIAFEAIEPRYNKTMKTMTVTELKSILASHKLWVETKGKQGQRANLVGAALSGTYLCDANLEGANLLYSNLEGANLTCANLEGANLVGANFCDANLKGANLEGANLVGANLEGANLEGAILKGAILKGAYLYCAYLFDANLEGANLVKAYLKGANLVNANLSYSNLEGASFYRASLYGANLENANLEGAILEDANLTNTVLDKKKKEETKMNMENENGFILSSEEKEMVLEYRKKIGKDKINQIRQTATALHNSFIAIKQIAGGGTYCVEVDPQANTKLLQEILSLFGTVNHQLHSSHSGDGKLQKQTLSFAMPSLD